MPMFREASFKFSIPGPIAGVSQTFFATEFTDQNYNRDHKLVANVSVGSFVLSFLTNGNIDEVNKKITVQSSSIDSTGGATAGWVLDFPMTGVYWSYEKENSNEYVYRLTFPFTLRNGANPAVATDIPAGGADLKIQIMANLV